MPKKARYPVELREKRVFKRSLGYDPIPPTKKRKRLRNKKTKKHTKYFKELKVEVVVSPRAYKHYKLNRKNKDLKNYNIWERKMHKFLKVFRKHLLENESGVFVKDFGYFYIMRHDQLTQRIKHQKVYAEGRRYSAMFSPIRKDTLLDTWCMDYGFTRTLNAEVYESIEKGIRYRMAYSLLYNFYGNQNNQIYLVEKNGNNA